LNVCANFVWYQLRFQNLPTSLTKNRAHMGR
jgi:hypothetical protein